MGGEAGGEDRGEDRGGGQGEHPAAVGLGDDWLRDDEAGEDRAVTGEAEMEITDQTGS